MSGYLRDVRLIPIVLLAMGSLFALKFSGLIFDGGYTLGERLGGANRSDLTITTRDSIPEVTPIIVADQRTVVPAQPKQSWAREMFNFGDVTGSVTKPAKPDPGITGSVHGGKPAEVPKAEAKKPASPPPDAGGKVITPQAEHVPPAGERAILERLQERREELDARTRELSMREHLLKAAEKRVEVRVLELKDLEKRVTSATEARDQAELTRFKNIVAMYESMKAKEAARIFDRLDLKVLVEVSTQIAPRKMSEILAQMTPEAAERLTVELANRASAEKRQPSSALPKIEGKPDGS
jgi:flagellar motility protein MotE (MotC chaperone)